MPTRIGVIELNSVCVWYTDLFFFLFFLLHFFLFSLKQAKHSLGIDLKAISGARGLSSMHVVSWEVTIRSALLILSVHGKGHHDVLHVVAICSRSARMLIDWLHSTLFLLSFSSAVSVLDCSSFSLIFL
jgi:hypothetical protein